MRLWQPFIAPSLKELYADNRATNRSLGIFKPDPDSIKFTVKPAKDADAADRAVAEQIRQMQQSSFLEDPLTPLEKPELAFGYRFTSGGHSHDPLIHDWEVQEAYRQYKRRYGDAALDHLTPMYGETIPARNLHLVMGTMLAHPRTFIIIGLLRSGLDPPPIPRNRAWAGNKQNAQGLCAALHLERSPPPGRIICVLVQCPRCVRVPNYRPRLPTSAWRRRECSALYKLSAVFLIRFLHIQIPQLRRSAPVKLTLRID